MVDVPWVDDTELLLLAATGGGAQPLYVNGKVSPESVSGDPRERFAMVRVRRVATLAAVAVAALAALTGCSDDAPQGTVLGNGDQESTNDTSTPSPTSSSPSTSTPDEDVVATDGSGDVEAATRADIKAFVQKYLKEQNKATGNGDFSTVETLISKSCAICQASKDAIAQIYADGNHVEGGVFVDPKVAVKAQVGDAYVVQVLSDVSDATILDASGEEVGTEPGSTGKIFVYRVQKVDGAWRVVKGDAQS